MLANFTGQSKSHLGQRRRTSALVRAPSGAGKFLSILKEQMASGGTEDRWIGRTLTGAYRLAERLGKGGMGAVYRAEHIRTSGLRAIKILLPEAAADPDIYRRFEDEAKITSALRHPNIVQVMDFDTDADTPFIVMEYLDGVTLDAQLRKNGPMSLAEGIELLRQVGSALHAARCTLCWGCASRHQTGQHFTVSISAGWKADDAGQSAGFWDLAHSSVGLDDDAGSDDLGNAAVHGARDGASPQQRARWARGSVLPCGGALLRFQRDEAV